MQQSAAWATGRADGREYVPCGEFVGVGPSHGSFEEFRRWLAAKPGGAMAVCWPVVRLVGFAPARRPGVLPSVGEGELAGSRGRVCDGGKPSRGRGRLPGCILTGLQAAWRLQQPVARPLSGGMAVEVGLTIIILSLTTAAKVIVRQPRTAVSSCSSTRITEYDTVRYVCTPYDVA